VTVEHQALAFAGTFEDADRVVALVADRLQGRTEVRAAQHFVQRAGHVAFAAGRAWHVDQLHDQVDQPVAVDVLEGTRDEIRIGLVAHAGTTLSCLAQLPQSPATMCVVRVPSFSMLASTRSPGFSHSGTAMPAATPGGLPLVMMSPGSSVVFDHQETSSAVL
jgi:hypothetical protein